MSVSCVWELCTGSSSARPPNTRLGDVTGVCLPQAAGAHNRTVQLKGYANIMDYHKIDQRLFCHMCLKDSFIINNY